MRTINITISLFLLLFLVSSQGFSQGEKKLTLLQTSDTHSRIEPINADSGDKHADMGGFARRAAVINELRKENPNLLLFDCGDFSQGTPYYNIFKGEVEIKMMNLMKYDAVLIGNHEFDYGIDNMVTLFKMAQFPIIASNYNVDNSPLKGLVKPYIILENDGLKIGVIGVCAKLEGLVQTVNYEDVEWLEPVSIGNELAAFLKEQERCDVVICLSHLGIKGDEKFIQATSNIDVVLGGHSHTWMDEPVFYINAVEERVPLLHTGKNGVFLGEIDIFLNK